MFRSRVFWSVLAVLLLVGPALQAAPRFLDDTPRMVVMSAFEPEWLTLLERTDGQKEHVLNGKRFVTGRLAGKDVLLVLSGVSMVNAAMTAQQVIDRFNVSAIVFSGIAGGVDPSLKIGDVVIADQWGEYLENVLAREVDGRYVLPPFYSKDDFYPNFGMMFPRNVKVTREGLDKPEHRFWFPVDAGLLAVARGMAGGVTLENCDEKGTCLTHKPRIVVGGHGVSGQSFVDNAKFRTYAFDRFEARVLDMESAAVAHVAFTNGVPFIAFRSLSDLAGGGEGGKRDGRVLRVGREKRRHGGRGVPGGDAESPELRQPEFRALAVTLRPPDRPSGKARCRRRWRR